MGRKGGSYKFEKRQKELKKHALIPGSRTQYRQFLGGTRPTPENIDKLADARFRGDGSKPNGSSIAFLAEYDGKSALIVGDAPGSKLDKARELGVTVFEEDPGTVFAASFSWGF